MIKDHVLLAQASELKIAAQDILGVLDMNTIGNIISSIPDDWLTSDSDSLSITDMRAAYLEYLLAKISMINQLVKEAEDAR